MEQQGCCQAPLLPSIPSSLRPGRPESSAPVVFVQDDGAHPRPLSWRRSAPALVSREKRQRDGLVRKVLENSGSDIEPEGLYRYQPFNIRFETDVFGPGSSEYPVPSKQALEGTCTQSEAFSVCISSRRDIIQTLSSTRSM